MFSLIFNEKYRSLYNVHMRQFYNKPLGGALYEETVGVHPVVHKIIITLQREMPYHVITLLLPRLCFLVHTRHQAVFPVGHIHAII